jgi:hypothetical protein
MERTRSTRMVSRFSLKTVLLMKITVLTKSKAIGSVQMERLPMGRDAGDLPTRMITGRGVTWKSCFGGSNQEVTL